MTVPPSSTISYPLGDLLDIPVLEKLLIHFCDLVGIAAAIIDLEGRVLAAARWQRACTDFHRVHPETCAQCIESDVELATSMHQGKPYALYRCKNGLTDAAAPIIIDGHHLANVFVGQFFLHPPDLAFFAEQAERYGFDKPAYLAVLQEVPIIDERRVPLILDFATSFANTIAESGWRKLEALRLAEDQRRNATSTEAFYRHALENVPEGLVIVDTQRRIVLMNNEMERLFGYLQGELLGCPLEILLPEAARPGLIELWPGYLAAPCIRRMDPSTDELQGNPVGQRKDGGTFAAEMSLAPLTRDGLLTHVAFTARDISQRLAAERQIAEQGELLRQMMEAVECPIFYRDVETRFLTANQAYYHCFGTTAEDMVGTRLTDGFPPKAHPASLSSSIATHQEVVATRRPTRLESTLLFADGRQHDVISLRSPVLNKDGEVYGVIGTLIDITEQKNTERALAVLEEKSRLVLEAASDGIIEIDDGGLVRFANPAALSLLGFAPEELLGQNLHQLTHHHHLDGTPHSPEECPMHLTLVHGSPGFSDSEVFWRKDGTPFPVEYRTAAIVKEGKIAGVVASFRDISAHVEHTRQIRESEERLDLAVSAGRIGMWDWNIVSNTIVVSETYAQILGYTQEEVLDRFGSNVALWLESQHPDDREAVAEDIRKNLTGESPEFRRELRLRSRTGAWFWILDTGRVVERDAQGRASRMVGTIQDITERKELEDFNKQLVEAMPNPVFFKGPDRKFQGCNRAFLQFAGRSLEQIIGKGAADVYPEDVAINAEESDRRILETGASDTYEGTLENNAGRRRAVIFYKSALKNRSGETTGIVGTFLDITDLKAAREAAEAANRAKSEFLANMSHEIRTPMNGVIGFAHLLQQTELDHRQRDYVHKIQTSAEHQLAIVNDVLDFSKIEAGKTELEIIDMSLHDLLGNVASLLAPQCDRKGLEFILDVAADVPDAILADPLRLRQILINLANNALKFTSQGEIIIRVRSEESGRQLRFAVIDSGCGMTSQQLGRLFTAFTQGDSAITRQYGGTGLGLSISRALVEMMGGTINVESRTGSGSTFWFTLPVHLGQGDQIVHRHLGVSRRVLAVDDHPMVQEILGDMLRTLGLAADTCGSGEDALARLRAACGSGRPYDLLLLDWKMPGMDGFEVARRLHATPEISPKPLLVLISSYDSQEIQQQLTALGFKRFLAKPINHSQLYEAMAALLTSGEARTPVDTREDAAAVGDLSLLAGRRVLLVEDNIINQQVGLELLTAAGVTTDVADNGRIAVAMVAAQPYDLVLMDMHMPVMDGVTATRLIRETHNRTALPILAFTANAIVSELHRCLDAGMNDTITKPIDPADLYAKLQRWLPPRGQRRPREEAEAGGGTRRAPGSGLPAIDGLDAQAGVCRLLGNSTVYRRILRGFVASEAEAASRIRAHLAANAPAEAQREAHSLKGAAGTVGAIRVQQLASELEMCLRADLLPDDAALANLERTLTTLVTALRSWLDSPVS